MDVFWRYGLKNIFFRNKTFLFYKIECWNFQVRFEIKIRETSQNFNSFRLFRQLLFSYFSIVCLIELKFCKVSGNSISNWTWKFELSIFKNKKVLFLKKKLSRCQYQNKKVLFTDSIFQKVLRKTVGEKVGKLQVRRQLNTVLVILKNIY